MNAARLLATALAQAQPGKVFGGYRLLDELGRGAMGVVFSACHLASKRMVALKMPRADADLALAQRFRSEAEAAAALDHPGVLPIHEVGESEGVPFFTMRFAECGSLAGRVNEFQNDPRAAVRMIEKVADALAHAHERGLLHRDIKPSNILLTAPDEPLLGDFGLARWLGRDSALTVAGSVLGTPSYLAPELLGEKPDATTASDLFSLGAVLYHLLCGRPPFEGESVAATLALVAEAAPTAPRSFNAALPRDLEAIVLRSIEREPARRYGSVREFAADLRHFLAGEPVIARTASPVGIAWRWARRNPALAIVSLAAFGVAAAFAVHFVVSREALLKSGRLRAEAAERLASERLRASLLARAELLIREPRAGHRAAALAALGEAWRIQPAPEIRDAAIGALAAFDAELVPSRDGIIFSPTADPPLPPTKLLDGLTAQAWHAESRLAAYVGTGKSIRVFTAGGALLHALPGHEGTVRALAFTHRGDVLASAADDGSMRFWDLRRGEQALVMGLAAAPDGVLRWSADDSHVALGDSVTVRAHWPALVRRYATLHAENVRERVPAVSISADERWLAATGADGVRVWEIATGRERGFIEKIDAEWMGVVFSPTDASTLWIGGWDSGLVRHTLRDGVPSARLAVPETKGGALIAQSPDGRWLATLNDAVAGFELIDTTAPAGPRVLAHPSPFAIAFDHTSRAVTASYASGELRIWDVASGRRLHEFPALASTSIEFTHDGRHLLEVRDATILRRRAADWTEDAAVSSGERLRIFAPSPDGAFLAVATTTRLNLRRAAPPFARVAPLPLQWLPPRTEIAGLAFSPRGDLLAVRAADGAVFLWNLAALRLELRSLGMELP